VVVNISTPIQQLLNVRKKIILVYIYTEPIDNYSKNQRGVEKFVNFNILKFKKIYHIMTTETGEETYSATQIDYFNFRALLYKV
jgi:hypothetical protein